MNPRQECPCGSGQPYADCCGRFVDARALPATAQELMRSRYTAYVLGREDYLLATWHPRTRPERLGTEDDAGLRWLGLDIRRVEAGGPDDREGSVEFVARCKRGGRAQRIHERSRFLREGGRWLYLDGEHKARG